MEPQALPTALPERQVTCSEKERKKKKAQHLAALLLFFFFSVATQNFSRQRRAPAPAVPTGGTGPRTTHPGVVGVGEG